MKFWFRKISFLNFSPLWMCPFSLVSWWMCTRCWTKLVWTLFPRFVFLEASCSSDNCLIALKSKMQVTFVFPIHWQLSSAPRGKIAGKKSEDAARYYLYFSPRSYYTTSLCIIIPDLVPSSCSSSVDDLEKRLAALRNPWAPMYETWLRPLLIWQFIVLNSYSSSCVHRSPAAIKGLAAVH